MGGVEVEEGQARGEGGDSPISRAQGRTLSSLSLFFFPSTVYPGIPTLNLNQRPTPLRPDPLSVNLVPWSAPTLSYRGSLYSKFPSSLTIIPSLTPYLLPFKNYPTLSKCGSLTPVTPLCLPSPPHQISSLLLPHPRSLSRSSPSPNHDPPFQRCPSHSGCEAWLLALAQGNCRCRHPLLQCPWPSCGP